MTPASDPTTANFPDAGAPTRSVPPAASGSLLGTASADAVRALEAFKQGLTAPPPAELDPPPGFEVENQLGYGGMGAVYLAKQLGLNRPVALKLVKSTQAIEAKALIRFLAEAEVVAAVRHPNVVEVFQYGEHNGRPYLALEYCPGGDFTKLVSRETTASAPRDAAWFRRVAELMAGVADGVNAAHLLGIVHRDLKPANVLLAADGTPKVADFGLAKRGLGSDLTHSGAVLGTPAYMSPEQAKGDTKFVGPEADVWALGVMLYELCCGERPTDTSGPVMDAIARVAKGDVPQLRTKLPSVPKDLALVIQKCLSADPRDRYPTAGGLAADLRNWLDGRPISVRPMSTVARVWRWTRRNRIATGLIAALGVIVVLLATVGHLWLTSLAAQAEVAAAKAEAATANAEAESQRAVQQERGQAQTRRIQDGYLARAKLASQRGASKEAVAAYEEAVAVGATLTDLQQLDRLEHYFRLLDPARRAKLLAIDPAILPASLRGRWHLLNGFDLLTQDEKQATGELERAIELLPADSWEKSFAKGMLEPDVEKAMKLLDEAIDRNPTALDPRHVQMFVLFVHGRFAEVIQRAQQARIIAPDDPQTALLCFLAYCAQRQKGEAKRLVPVLKQGFPAEAVEVLEVVAPIFLGGSVEGGASDLFQNREFLTFLALGGLPKLQRAMTFLGGGETGQPVIFARSPRCVQPLNRLLGYMFRNLFDSFDKNNPLKGITSQPGGSLLTDAQFEEMKGYAATSPEGFVRWWYAGELMTRNKLVTSGGFNSRDRKVLAPEAVAVAEQYEAAYRAKGFIFDARRMSLEGAILYYAVAALGVSGGDPDDTDPAIAKRGAALLREWLTDPRVKDTDFQFLSVSVQVRMALFAGDRGLAQTLMDRAEKQKPNDWGLPMARAYVFAELGNWEEARLNAMMVLEGNPEQPHMLRIFRQSTTKLQQLGKAGY